MDKGESADTPAALVLIVKPRQTQDGGFIGVGCESSVLRQFIQADVI